MVKYFPASGYSGYSGDAYAEQMAQLRWQCGPEPDSEPEWVDLNAECR